MRTIKARHVLVCDDGIWAKCDVCGEEIPGTFWPPFMRTQHSEPRCFQCQCLMDLQRKRRPLDLTRKLPWYEGPGWIEPRRER